METDGLERDPSVDGFPARLLADIVRELTGWPDSWSRQTLALSFQAARGPSRLADILTSHVGGQCRDQALGPCLEIGI